MQYLTEQDLMARCGLGQGVELHLSPEERLTPSAQELVNNRKIRILIVSGDGRVARDDGKAVHPLATEERPFAKVEKTEAQTHLNGTEMVTKEHPRIWFRGKVDSAITAAILVQTQLQPVLAPELQGLLADLRSWLGWAMRCEVLDEAVPVLSMGLCGGWLAILRSLDWNRCVPMRRKVPFLPYSIGCGRSSVKRKWRLHSLSASRTAHWSARIFWSF